MTELIICEKPAAALKIATALADKTPKKTSVRGVAYYTLTHKGKEILVGCAVGHIFTVGEKTKKNTYPSFEIEWQPSHLKSISSKFTKKYLDTLKSLSKKADEFTVACDYDIEGSTIGANVVFFVAEKKDAKLMNKRKGNVILVRVTAISIFLGSPSKPGAIRKTNTGIKISIRRTKKNNNKINKLKILLAKACDFFLLFNKEE